MRNCKSYSNLTGFNFSPMFVAVIIVFFSFPRYWRDHVPFLLLISSVPQIVQMLPGAPVFPGPVYQMSLYWVFFDMSCWIEQRSSFLSTTMYSTGLRDSANLEYLFKIVLARIIPYMPPALSLVIPKYIPHTTVNLHKYTAFKNSVHQFSSFLLVLSGAIIIVVS